MGSRSLTNQQVAANKCQRDAVGWLCGGRVRQPGVEAPTRQTAVPGCRQVLLSAVCREITGTGMLSSQ